MTVEEKTAQEESGLVLTPSRSGIQVRCPCRETASLENPKSGMMAYGWMDESNATTPPSTSVILTATATRPARSRCDCPHRKHRRFKLTAHARPQASHTRLYYPSPFRSPVMYSYSVIDTELRGDIPCRVRVANSIAGNKDCITCRPVAIPRIRNGCTIVWCVLGSDCGLLVGWLVIGLWNLFSCLVVGVGHGTCEP